MDIMLQRIIELIGRRHGETKNLAEAIGVSANLITDWKAGRAKSYTKYAPQIAEYYGVSLDWLSGLTDEKTPKEKPATQMSTELSPLDIQLIQLLPMLTEQDKVMFLAQIKGVLASRGQ